jgi:hypothetical protein
LCDLARRHLRNTTTRAARRTAAPPALMPAMAPIEIPDGDVDFDWELSVAAVEVSDAVVGEVPVASVVVELSMLPVGVAVLRTVGGAVS